MTYVRAILLLVALLCAAAPLSQGQQYILSVDVELVNVTATVIDSSDRYWEGLTAGDFQVLENGQEQNISFFSHDKHVPISVGLLIDTSGSLQYKFQQALQTAREIAATLSPDDEMFIITFNSRAEVRQKFTNNQEEIRQSLHNIRAGGETAVYDAISLGLQEMKTAKHRKRTLLMLTDCFDTRSKIKADQIEDSLKRSDVLLYAIGIDDGNNLKPRKGPRYRIYDYMLGKLTSAGGGRLIRVYTDDFDQRRVAEALLGELHQQYTMGYYPVADATGNPGLRSIEVRVAKPGARILGEKLHLVPRG
jgi:Ca-activated chloride channel family protein